MQSKQANNEDSAFYFTVQSNILCLELNDVCSTLPLMSLQTIPSEIPSFVGLLHDEQKAVPIYDMSIAVGIDRFSTYTTENNLIICNFDSLEIGFVVDEIHGVGQQKSYDLNATQLVSLNTKIFNSAVMGPWGPTLKISSSQLLDTNKIATNTTGKTINDTTNKLPGNTRIMQ